jgi:hypothetical protein
MIHAQTAHEERRSVRCIEFSGTTGSNETSDMLSRAYAGHSGKTTRINDHIHPSRPTRSRLCASSLDPRTTPTCRIRGPYVNRCVTVGAVTLPD